jgi:ATP-binding cassette subfamily F protein 3
MEQSVYDHIRKLMPEAPASKVRARAGNIGFSGKAADTTVKSLSGGEKARLLLGLATFYGPNLIILDEPTNHLDIDSRAMLAEAINEFAGAVIMVSHDRYLIEACADQLWVVANKTVTNFDGDLEDYRKQVMQIRDPRTPARERVATEDKPVRTKEKRSSPKQQVAEAETEMARIAGIIAKIDTALALPDIFTKDPKQAAQLTKARAAAADALARAEEQWLNASALLEDANSA